MLAPGWKYRISECSAVVLSLTCKVSPQHSPPIVPQWLG